MELDCLYSIPPVPQTPMGVMHRLHVRCNLYYYSGNQSLITTMFWNKAIGIVLLINSYQGYLVFFLFLSDDIFVGWLCWHSLQRYTVVKVFYFPNKKIWQSIIIFTMPISSPLFQMPRSLYSFSISPIDKPGSVFLLPCPVCTSR